MKPLPKPNIEVRKSGDAGEFTAKQIRGFICNPIYASHPTPDAEWIRSAEKMITEEGAQQFLVNMIYALRASGVMPGEPSPHRN
jgi:hypothetical protein